MGEIMFNYTVDNSPVKHETMFKYWYNMSKEQSFAYQRFVALFDARTFNEPVAITKVATGFVDLHQLFVTQNAHSVLTQSQTWIDTRSSIEPQVSDNVFGQNINHLGQFPSDKIVYFLERPKLEGMNTERTLFGNTGDIIANSKHEQITGSKEWNLFKHDYTCMGSDEEIIANYEHQNMMSCTDRISFTPLPIYIGTPFDNRLNFFFEKELNAIKIPIIRPTNFIVDAFMSKMRLGINLYEDIYGYQDRKKINPKGDIKAYVSQQTLDINKEVYGFRPMPYVNFFKYYHASYDDRYFYKASNVSLSKDNPKGHKEREDIASKDMPNTNFIKNFFLCTDNINANVAPELFVYTFGKTSGYLSLDSFAVTPNRVLNVTDGTSVSYGGDIANIIPGWYDSQGDGKEVDYIKNIFCSSNGKELFSSESLIGVYDSGCSSKYIPYIITASSNGKNVGEFKKNSVAFKMNGNFKYLPDGFFTIKNYGKSFISYDNFFVQKSAVDVGINESLCKSSWFNKIPLPSSVGIHGVWYSKIPKNIQTTLNSFFINKDSYSVSLRDDSSTAQLVKKSTSIFAHGVNVLKKRTVLSINEKFDMVIKTALDIGFYGASQYDALIIPISKLRKQSFIDRIDEMVNKINKPVFISGQTFASAIPKPLGFPNLDVFFDKKDHEVFIQYKNIFITKSRVHSVITSNAFVSKMSKSINVYNKSPFAIKSPSLVWTYDKQDCAIKSKKDIFITCNDLELLCLPHEINIYNNDSFMEKLPKLCYYSYGSLISKEKHDIIAKEQELIHRINYDINVMDMSGAIRPIREFYYNQICYAEVFRNGSNPLYSQIDGLYRTYREVKMAPNDFGNWAWVYEDPDTLGDIYDIDELLLPEIDTRYKDFEDIIFDKKNLRPKNPVKKIDDTTFICKYPTKHPLPDYSNIGVVYLDVRTEIMHEVFLKFYRIWQSKIFEFSMMTMSQSVAKMLEYLYSWIMLYYPQDKIEEALRVFRQIRWYGEMAILQNSQYIVSYEYEDLKSKLNTGTCAIPNDIDPDKDGNITNPTMFVDAENAVIRNNPDLIGKSDARVKFTVNIKKNTTFSFSLINTIGSVNIYIDSVLVDTVSVSKLNLTYPLEYTGKPIVIDIVKTKQNNLNHLFCIGNIIIAKGTFKELSIEFDPVLKAGNQPLDEIAKKMIQYANEHDDISDAYEHILKTNVGVSETYKRMVEYWEIHHQDKKKGKRLTIKQV